MTVFFSLKLVMNYFFLQEENNKFRKEYSRSLSFKKGNKLQLDRKLLRGEIVHK